MPSIRWCSRHPLSCERVAVRRHTAVSCTAQTRRGGWTRGAGPARVTLELRLTHIGQVAAAVPCVLAGGVRSACMQTVCEPEPYRGQGRVTDEPIPHSPCPRLAQL